MDKRGDEIHVTETEVSGGSKEGVVRWVLIIGLILAIGALTLIWTTGALVQEEGADSETNVRSTSSATTASEDRGEPIAPAIDGAEASPAADATPGDAPAGDPKPDGQ